MTQLEKLRRRLKNSESECNRLATAILEVKEEVLAPNERAKAIKEGAADASAGKPCRIYGFKNDHEKDAYTIGYIDHNMSIQTDMASKVVDDYNVAVKSMRDAQDECDRLRKLVNAMAGHIRKSSASVSLANRTSRVTSKARA